jgi:phosphatidylglycerol---prolipoprotein diacylglyceryl transferase
MYPSLYYAIKDLFGIDLPFLKMIQSFGFFVAMGFLTGAYFLAYELKRKENQGLLHPIKFKYIKGQKVTSAELLFAAFIGFLLGYKIGFILLHFSEFTENTQAYILSTAGSWPAAIVGAGISAYLKYREKEKEKLPTPLEVEEKLHPYQLVGNLTMIAAISGLLGAKIFHNLENWDEFAADPIGALLSFSGLTMYGGLICGSISVITYAKSKGINTKHLIDASAPALMISYAVGRIGCQVAGDGDWGIDNTAPKPNWLNWLPDWMWSYDYAHNVNSIGEPIANCFGNKYCYHLVPSVFPTPFYETIMCTILFFVLWKLRNRITTAGVLFSVYLILNGVERFLIEKIRVNTLYHIGNFSFTQAELISVLLIITGIAGVWHFSKHKEQPVNSKA